MRKYIWLIIIGVIVAVGLTGYFVVEAKDQPGSFERVSHTNAKAALFDKYNDVYIGSKIVWDGDSKPLIRHIEIIKDDGTPLSQENEAIHVELYIDESNETNVLYGYNPQMRQIVGDYHRVNNYELKQPIFTLVLKVSLLQSNYQFDLKELHITYEENGMEKEQTLPLRNFVFHH
ncbi:hypothetical protein [Halalkalibacillus halophilus]|uniref:hypothetical protein n=1 Tax=Halalkalibacillus halophilus TaxID=392827 RepID=UPI0004269F0D|nr:hypothetical protein [Halalkalibacillus halophilus]